MQTPRATSAEDGGFKAPLPRQKVQQKSGNDASTGEEKKQMKPRKFFKKDSKKPSKEEDSGESYRDRAKERRTGANPDFEESEGILAMLSKKSVPPLSPIAGS